MEAAGPDGLRSPSDRCLRAGQMALHLHGPSARVLQRNLHLLADGRKIDLTKIHIGKLSPHGWGVLEQVNHKDLDEGSAQISITGCAPVLFRASVGVWISTE